ncbi:hypothetical protein EJ04DRAFT_581396 [Polyplosphaeria fusca]|uniref:Tyrosine specific protein phosphatases domain-containing protein n=1 Tax=Polyplosphaeria fusca TaxID=682080 RepID=A0A9P4UXP7_9PLEO|nr:hypothetical protein EJ04DRAFT_581396 [Polyplosphaeria fusca]
MHSPLPSIPNFRDVGAFINDASGSERLRRGILFRGARPDEASYLDRKRLVHEFGIHTIIDLRTKTEHLEQAQKRGAKIKASAAIVQSNEETSEPLKIPSVEYRDINFNGSSYSRMLMSKLSWLEFFKLIWLMMLGYRTDGIKVLAPHINSMGLNGLGTSSLDVCTSEVRQFFEILANEKQWPLFVHCTQGKDRTGLTVMLVLLLLGVEGPLIEQDYLFSEGELEAEMDDRISEIRTIGLSPSFARCSPDFTQTVVQHIAEKHGSVENYLKGVGVTIEMQTTVKKILLV